MAGRRLHRWAWLGAWVLALALAASAAVAGQAVDCRQCHLSDASRVLAQLSWQGPLEQGRLLPCPGRQALQEDLWATEGLLGALSAQWPGLAGRGYFVGPWRQALHQARQRLARAMARPLEDGQAAAQELAQLRAQVRQQVLEPLGQETRLASLRLWGGLVLLGAILLALAWLVGLYRGLPRQAGERIFSQVKAGRLP